MVKKTRFIVGISLLIQAIPHLVIFIVLAATQKKLWKTLLPITCTESVLGFIMVLPEIIQEINKIQFADDFWSKSERDAKKKAKKSKEKANAEQISVPTYVPERKKPDVPVDDTANETEFN